MLLLGYCNSAETNEFLTTLRAVQPGAEVHHVVVDSVRREFHFDRNTCGGFKVAGPGFTFNDTCVEASSGVCDNVAEKAQRNKCGDF